MKTRLLAVVLVVVLMLGLAPDPTLGQDEKPVANEAVEACSTDQIDEMRPLVLPYAQGYQQLVETMGQTEKPEQIDALIQLTNQLQVAWWSEAVPQLPDCALANQLELTYGRLIDETLLALIFFRFGADEDASPHFLAMTTLGLDMTALTAEIDPEEDGD